MFRGIPCERGLGVQALSTRERTAVVRSIVVAASCFVFVDLALGVDPSTGPKGLSCLAVKSK